MKRAKQSKLLAILLAAAMMFSMVPTMAFAEALDTAMSGNCGATENDTVTWKLEQNNENSDNPTYTLTISGAGAMEDYTTNAGNANATQPWKDYRGSITKIVIENSVTRLGNYAFNGLTSVTNFTISKSVTEIGNWAIDVTSMDSFQVESGNPSFKLVDGVLFSADGTTLIGYPGGKEEVSSYTVPDGVVTISNGAFTSCKIKELTFSDSVASVGTWMFGSKSTIETVHFEIGITQIGAGAFDGTASLKTVTFPETVSELSIGKTAFQSTGITEITFPSGTKEIGDKAFKNCKSLEKIAFLGSSKGLSIGKQTFQNNTSLKSVILPESISVISSQGFSHCSSLAEITFHGASDNLVIGDQAFSGCSSLTSIALPEGIKEIGGSAFLGLGNLTEVTFPETVSAEGLSIGNGAFQKTGLTSLILPANVTSLGNSCFNTCSQLSSIEWAEPASNATIGSYVFLGCNQVEKLVIPEGVVELKSQALGQMSGLKYIKLPSTVNTLGKLSLHVLGSLEVLDMTLVTTCENFYKENNAYAWLNASPKIIYISSTDMEESVANKNYASSIAITNGGTFSSDTQFTSSSLATPIKDNYYFDGWYSGDGTKLSGAPTAGTIYTAKWEGSSYLVNPTNIAFGSITYGAVSGNQAITVNGSGSTDTLSATSSNENVFTVSVNGKTITVTPIPTLAVGDYSETVYITTPDGATFIVPVTLTVTKNNSETEDNNSTATATYGEKLTLSVKTAPTAISPYSLRASLNEVWFYYGNTLLGKASVSYSGDNGTATYEYDTTRGIIPAGSQQVVTAVYGGSDNLEDSLANITVTINKAAQEISYDTTSVEKHVSDAAFTTTLTKTTVYGAISYSSSDTDVATVDENGQVTIKGAGETTITATAAATDNYKEATATYTLTATGHDWETDYTIDKEATCTTDGSKSIHCKDCDVIKEDTVTVIPATGHSYSESWESDENGHWHACTVCQEKDTVSAHTFQWVIDKEATATDKGGKHEECSVCHYKKAAVEIPATGKPADNKPSDNNNSNGNTGNSSTSNSSSPKTGDNSNLVLWVVLLAVSMGGLGTLLLAWKKQSYRGKRMK